MTLIISIILIYLTLINIYFYTKERKKFLGFTKWSQYFISLGILIFFIFFVFIFLRILNIFRESKIIDIKFFVINYNIIFILLLIIFFFSLRKLLFFFFKISFFRLHYFYLAPENNKYYLNYYNFYIKYFYNFCVKYYDYFFWLDKIMLFILLVFFIKDCYLLNFVLKDIFFFFKFYSLFKLTYIIIRFVATKQQLILDYYIFNLCYQNGVSLDEGFFAETLSKKAGQIIDYQENIIQQ